MIKIIDLFLTIINYMGIYYFLIRKKAKMFLLRTIILHVVYFFQKKPKKKRILNRRVLTDIITITIFSPIFIFHNALLLFAKRVFIFILYLHYIVVYAYFLPEHFSVCFFEYSRFIILL